MVTDLTIHHADQVLQDIYILTIQQGVVCGNLRWEKMLHFKFLDSVAC